MKGIFALEYQQDLKSELPILPDVTQDKEKRAKAEALMRPLDVKHIKIPSDMTDDKFDHVIYREPVITSIGNTYESEKISAWLETNNTDPSDNTELETKNLIPNKACLSRVNLFLDKNPQLRDSTELYLPRRWVGELELACQNGDLDVIKRLYDLDRRLFSWTFDFTEAKYSAYQGKNILHIACKPGKIDAIARLLELMEKRTEGLALLMLLQRDKQGKLPIQYAMENETDPRLMRVLASKMNKYLNEVEPVLLSTSEDQENRYRTVLHIAAMNNDANTVSFLADHKADLNVKDRFGNTALHIALGYGSNEAVQALIRAGSSEVIENDQEQTPEKVGEGNNKLETVQILKEALEQRNKTQQRELKDGGPLAQMVLGMKTSLDQLTAKSQKQEREINELQTAITLLYHEIGYLRLNGHFLNRETIYDRRHKRSGGSFFGLPLFLSEKTPTSEAQTFWEPRNFGTKPISKKELRKLILEDLPPHTQQALFYIEEKGSSQNYQLSELKGDQYLLTAVEILPNGNIISGYTNGTIRIWDFKGTCIKSLEGTGSSLSVTALPDGGFISCSDTVLKIWNVQGKCLNTIETRDESNRWSYCRYDKRLVVLPDGKIVIGQGNSLKIWEQKGVCTSTIALGKPEYKRLIIDSITPKKIEPDILYITVDEKGKQCDIRSTDIQTPIMFNDNSSFSRLARLLTKYRSAELDLPQDITEVRKISNFNDILKFNEPINLTSLTVWNDRIVAGLDDRSIKVLQADGKLLGVLVGHADPVSALAALPNGNLVSVDDQGAVKFWDTNNFQCIDTVLFGIKLINNLKIFPDGTLVVANNEKIIFWSKAHNRLPSFPAKGAFAILPDAQAVLYSAENIIRYIFVGKPMLLNFSFQKELLLANAKLHQLDKVLMIKTIRPCLKSLVELGVALQKLCGEFQLNIEFSETEMRISNLSNVELIADLENLCQLFGAEKFIPAPALPVKTTTQPILEEAKRHRVTGSLIPPLTSPITVIGSGQRQGTKKDYFNTKENSLVSGMK